MFTISLVMSLFIDCLYLAVTVPGRIKTQALLETCHVSLQNGLNISLKDPPEAI